jgi:hypothetical protein
VLGELKSELALDTKNNSTGLVKFGTITREAALRSRRQAKAGKANFFKFKEGSNLVRFMPGPEGSSVPWVVTHQHFLKGWAGGKRALVFNCPIRAGEGACPACQKEEVLLATGNPIDKKKSEDFRPRARVYANIIDRKDPETGVQVAAFGSQILEQLVELIDDEEVYGADFTHPFEGDDLAIKRTEEKGTTTYKVNIRTGDNDRLAETEEQMVKWITTAANLNRYGEILTYEQIMEAGKALKDEAQGTSPARSTQKQAVASAPTTQPKAIAEAQPAQGLDDGGTLESAAGGSEGEEDDTPF